METNVRSPLEVFSLPQHLSIPLFQRPYVWQEEDQWAPFWQDVRRLAEARVTDLGTSATHFLGAVVVQSDSASLGTLPTSNIIDGQQRLTTLVLMMDAAAAVLEERGIDFLAAQLRNLTHNQIEFVQPGTTRLKLRHSNRDRVAFDLVMEAEPPVDYPSLPKSLLVSAHAYFGAAVKQWLGEGEVALPLRAQALVTALTRGLQLVVINLAASENSQEIFETLNARGTPLTAADLIKNFVFQRLAADHVDTKHAYSELWPFDTRFWDEQISVGRYLVSRSSLFLNQWLISRIGEEVSPQSTFTRFKSFVEHDAQRPMSQLLEQIKVQAEQYERWTSNAAEPDRQLTQVEMATYRMRANSVETLKPLLLWLHAPGRDVPDTVIDDVIRTAESWLNRRLLLRLTTSDLGRVVVELIRVHRDAPASELPGRVAAFLSSSTVVSTYWPGDAEIRSSLSGMPAYRRFPRGRLRMFLEAAEDHLRRETGQPQVRRGTYPIEHVLPQKWEDHWPVTGLAAEQDRAEHVHRFGNLTLLTKALNSRVSNGAWDGKRAAFQQHDTLLLTSRLVHSSENAEWGESRIDKRTNALIDAFLAIWPVPEGHTGEVQDSQDKAPEWVEVKHLVVAGLLPVGSVLQPPSGQWEHARATVNDSGLLEVDGAPFDSPSGAAMHVRGGATNGWYFWRLPDGRTLRDVRAAYQAPAAEVADL